MNQDIYRRIRARLDFIKKSEGKSATAICREANLGPDAIRDIQRRPHILPRLDTLAALAGPLKTSPEWLAFGRGAEDALAGGTASRAVPLVSWVAASKFAEVLTADAGSEWPTVHVADLPDGRFIALTVEGDSMNRIAVHHATIIVRTSDTVLIDRAFYVFQGADGATFKRYRDKDGPKRLEPYSTNPAHEIIYPTEDVRPVGRVFRVITDLYHPPAARRQIQV